MVGERDWRSILCSLAETPPFSAGANQAETNLYSCVWNGREITFLWCQTTGSAGLSSGGGGRIKELLENIWNQNQKGHLWSIEAAFWCWRQHQLSLIPGTESLFVKACLFEVMGRCKFSFVEGRTPRFQIHGCGHSISVKHEASFQKADI